MSDFSTRLIFINEGSIAKLVLTLEDNSIDLISISENKTIEKFDSNNSKIEKVDVINIASKKLIKKNSQSKIAKLKDLIWSKKLEIIFHIPGSRLLCTKLRQAFIKTPIFYHFNSECHLLIKINISGYAINEVLSKLNINNLS